MIEIILNAINFIRKIFDLLPQETKEKIINRVVEEATEIFNQYYTSAKKSKEKSI